jgi:ABC-type lipoprotein release transport system permease subunit
MKESTVALRELWTIAYRDLGRNRRRSLFTMLAVGLGLMLIIVLNGWIAGVFDNSLQNNIRLETGHLQLRAASYRSEQMSLKWEDLVSDSASLAARASAMSEVNAAAPVLWAPGVLHSADDSAGLKLYGIEPDSSIHAPIREGMVAGVFLTPDDRGGIVIGKRLADDLGIAVDQRVSLSVVNADGQPEEGIFTIRGLFSTGFPAYDQGAVFMPLAKAQAFTRTDGRASAILVMLHQQEDTDTVATALQTPGFTLLTWRDLNAVLLEALNTGQAMYAIMYGIVLLVVAVVIANTLLMAVFERIREIGILAALGMKRRQIVIMFVLEASIIGLIGIAIGNVLGGAGVAYLSNVGVYIGDMGAAVDNMALGTYMYAKFNPASMAMLSILTLAFTLLASLYPAWFAGRLEPVEALHSQ